MFKQTGIYLAFLITGALLFYAGMRMGGNIGFPPKHEFNRDFAFKPDLIKSEHKDEIEKTIKEVHWRRKDTMGKDARKLEDLI